jgi:hypothetical protein
MRPLHGVKNGIESRRGIHGLGLVGIKQVVRHQDRQVLPGTP